MPWGFGTCPGTPSFLANSRLPGSSGIVLPRSNTSGELCLCLTPNSETSQLSSNTWLRLATRMVSGSWGKAKVSVEKQVTFRSWNL